MKKDKFDKPWRQKSLEVLENDRWPDEKNYQTGLIKRCHDYRKIPIEQLTTEQLRTLVAQKIGLKYLIPIAIEFLTKDILSEGDLYPGDLLEAVLKADGNFWTQNLGLKESLVDLINLNLETLKREKLNIDNLEMLKSIN